MIGYIREGDMYMEADGWGTLITPSGTFTNVLRLKGHEVYQDSSAFDEEVIMKYETYVYSWVKPGIIGPLMNYTSVEATFMGQPMGSTALGTYNATQGLGIGGGIQNHLRFAMYPNPANGQSTVELQVTKAGQVITRIVDMTGREVMSQQENLSAGMQKVLLNLQGIQPGIYLVEVKMPNAVGQCKLVIE